MKKHERINYVFTYLYKVFTYLLVPACLLPLPFDGNEVLVVGAVSTMSARQEIAR